MKIVFQEYFEKLVMIEIVMYLFHCNLKLYNNYHVIFYLLRRSKYISAKHFCIQIYSDTITYQS